MCVKKPKFTDNNSCIILQTYQIAKKSDSPNKIFHSISQHRMEPIKMKKGCQKSEKSSSGTVTENKGASFYSRQTVWTSKDMKYMKDEFLAMVPWNWATRNPCHGVNWVEGPSEEAIAGFHRHLERIALETGRIFCGQFKPLQTFLRISDMKRMCRFCIISFVCFNY